MSNSENEKPTIKTDFLHRVGVNYPDESCHWWVVEITHGMEANGVPDRPLGDVPQAMLRENGECISHTEIDDPEELRNLARLCEEAADELEEAQSNYWKLKDTDR